MLERIVENWLTNASERSFQLPFCYTLQNQGHKILHLTRHRPIEFGKDVITIDSEGNYHAYQLKRGFISQTTWTDILPQLTQLCYQNLAHPHVPKDAIYTPYLVTNGGVDEEVYRALEDFNEGLKQADRPQLQILKYDDLYTDFVNLGAKLWPSELKNYKDLIEFTLIDGRGQLPTEKFISLLEKQLELNSDDIGDIKNKPSARRAVSSSALLTAYCASNFLKENNHVALIECWVLYISHVLAISEKLNIELKEFEGVIDIAKTIIFQFLQNLLEELEDREDLFEGNIILDKPFYHFRATRIIGLISTLNLWAQYRDEEALSDQSTKIVDKFIDECRLISEAHLPNFLSIYWSIRLNDATQRPVGFLRMLIETLINSSKNGSGLANPYYRECDLMPIHIQNKLQQEIDPEINIGADLIDDTFKYISFYLHGIIQIFVRLNYKQAMKYLWPKVTYFNFKYFQVEKKWHYFRWRNEKGNEKSILPKRTKSWQELRSESNSFDKTQIPDAILGDPIFGILFLQFYPHRVTSDLIKFLDSEIRYNIR